MASSAVYKKMADRFEAIKGQVSALSGSAQGLLDGVSSAKPYIKELIVSHDTIDKGKLDNLSSALEACIAAINAVVVECQTMVDYYMSLYYSALEQERLASIRAAAAKKTAQILEISMY